MTNDRSEFDEGRQLLRRSREEELSPADEERLEKLLATHPELRAEREALAETEARVAEAAPESFAPFFSSRVMGRLERRRDRAFSEQLAFLFRRLALAVLLLSASLATYNAATSPPSARDSLLETVVGVPSATLDDAYSLHLYDTP